jgi:hypothetical protein
MALTFMHRSLVIIYLKGSIAPDFTMFFPFLAWTWITSIDIIDDFHLGYLILIHTIIFHMLFELMFNGLCISFYFN